MSPRDAVYIGHMLDMASKATGKVRGLTREDFDKDENLRLALTRLVQVIGEAARQVSGECAARYPAVPWREIVGMRHKIVHDYLAVDEDVVWQVVTKDLPELVLMLQTIPVSGLR
ncbi:MAG: HepT-like ribonuclease domain-containing protein [Vicinamibacterales bacterium]